CTLLHRWGSGYSRRCNRLRWCKRPRAARSDVPRPRSSPCRTQSVAWSLETAAAKTRLYAGGDWRRVLVAHDPAALARGSAGKILRIEITYVRHLLIRGTPGEQDSSKPGGLLARALRNQNQRLWCKRSHQVNNKRSTLFCAA